jgi:putative Na+/H+ antiporter
MTALPPPLTAYPPSSESLWQDLVTRVHHEPFNALATAIFVLAILHTFAAGRFAVLARHVQHRQDERARTNGRRSSPNLAAELLHFLGEIEVVFGLWAVVLLIAISTYAGWNAAKHYVNVQVNYTEPLFVVVIMTLASTRPVIALAELALRRLASVGGATPAAWWITILTLGPMLGSFITEPAAMTICALLLGRQFYDLEPSTRLKYATLGLLFVNVSIGGTLTPFAAPPVLMVARPWGWNIPFMMANFGWRAALAIATSTGIYYLVFRRELRALASHLAVPDIEVPEAAADGPTLLPVPFWIAATHLGFMAWTVFTAHYPALFVGGFLFFLGFARATAAYQSRIELRTPLLVGFFLAGLVIHGGMQGWWIAPVLASLAEQPLFLAASVLTAFNDNALVTYLATLVPDLEHESRLALVQGAVVGGGLTVIANAPNPAGQALLSRFFGGAISPLLLLAGALGPTLLTALIFRLL